MNATKRISGFCTECGGSIEFRADLIGTRVACPRCGKDTELMLATPEPEGGVPKRVIAYTVAAVVILVAGLIATLVGLKRFEKLADRQRARAGVSPKAEAAAAPAGFEISGLRLEKGALPHSVMVAGTIVNRLPVARKQISAEFNLLDAAGQVVSVARAFRPMLEGGEKWEVNVPVEDAAAAVSVRLGALQEKSARE